MDGDTGLLSHLTTDSRLEGLVELEDTARHLPQIVVSPPDGEYLPRSSTTTPAMLTECRGLSAIGKSPSGEVTCEVPKPIPTCHPRRPRSAHAPRRGGDPFWQGFRRSSTFADEDRQGADRPVHRGDCPWMPSHCGRSAVASLASAGFPGPGNRAGRPTRRPNRRPATASPQGGRTVSTGPLPQLARGGRKCQLLTTSNPAATERRIITAIDLWSPQTIGGPP